MTGTSVTKCFADRLQDLIADSGKDVKTLAAEIGVSSGALSKYQNDKGEPGITALCKIAQYFGVTTDYLVGLTNNKTQGNADIGLETGLSDGAIELLKIAHAQKKIGNEVGLEKEYYPSDIFSLLIENLNYFPDLVLTISRELSIKEYHSEGIAAQKAEKYLAKDNPELFQKIYDNGDILLGAAYKDYLRSIIERNFGMLARFISGKINPCEFDFFIRSDIKNRSVNTLMDRIKKQMHEMVEEGANNADDPEAR